MACLSTPRMIAGPETSAIEGRIVWAASRSVWIGGMTAAALALAPFATTPGAILVFLAGSSVTLCSGHSIGLHRLLIHRSLSAPRWLTWLLAYLGTLVGMAGPLGMVRLHDTRDWAQRQAACHDYHAHRAPMWLDAWWQMHCRLQLAAPPRFVAEPELARDPVLAWLERTWMLQQLPWAMLLFWLGGLPWLVWGVPGAGGGLRHRPLAVSRCRMRSLRRRRWVVLAPHSGDDRKPRSRCLYQSQHIECQ